MIKGSKAGTQKDCLSPNATHASAFGRTDRTESILHSLAWFLSQSNASRMPSSGSVAATLDYQPYKERHRARGSWLRGAGGIVQFGIEPPASRIAKGVLEVELELLSDCVSGER